MSTVQLHVGSMRSLDYAQLDWRGEKVPKDQVTEYWLHIPFPVAGMEPGREFAMTTTVLAKIPLAGLPKEDRQIEDTVLHLAAAKLAKDFSRRHVWRTFGKEDIHLNRATPKKVVTKDTLATMPPVSVQAPPKLHELLTKDAATMERVNSAYAKAKDRLFDLITEQRRYEIPDCVHKIRSLLYFIEACNRCSADSWNAP